MNENIKKGLDLLFKGLQEETNFKKNLSILLDIYEFLSDGCYFVSINNPMQDAENWRVTYKNKEKLVKGLFVYPEDRFKE